MIKVRFKQDARRLAGIWGIVRGGWFAVLMLCLVAVYGTMLYLGWVFYRELGLLAWNGGRRAVHRIAQSGITWPRFGRAKVINMTGPQVGSYDKDGLPW